ncbi:hypothetical protein ACFVXH_18430 [Kitasatospora sp. NPDC058184]|uniref:hypothetical protein n=1 Tax=Kitasatospora sp. NPDC058184 TaxID=3346370 RepID=UPI0036D81A2D
MEAHVLRHPLFLKDPVTGDAGVPAAIDIGSMLAVVCASTEHLGKVAFHLVQPADDGAALTEAA